MNRKTAKGVMSHETRACVQRRVDKRCNTAEDGNGNDGDKVMMKRRRMKTMCADSTCDALCYIDWARCQLSRPSICWERMTRLSSQQNIRIRLQIACF